MKNISKIFLLLFLVSVSFVTAQKKDYSKEPGYVEFGDMTSLETGDMVTEVIIEEHLLKMVSKLTKHEDQELSDLISGLKLIKVNAYEVNAANEKQIKSRVDKIDKDLMDRKWDRIVRVKDRGENANVYIKTENDDKIVGLVVASFDREGEAAFVNIVGHINLETIGKLSNKFDIPSLDKVHKGEKDDKE